MAIKTDHLSKKEIDQLFKIAKEYRKILRLSKGILNSMRKASTEPFPPSNQNQ